MALRLKSGSKGNRRELIEENIFLWGMFVKNFRVGTVFSCIIFTLGFWSSSEMAIGIIIAPLF